MVSCRLLWDNRNKCFHDNRCVSPARIISKATFMINEYTLVNQTSETSTSRESVSWLPPIVGILNINTDAIYCALSNIATLCTVCIDSSGNVRFCAAARRHGVFSPLQAELMAISFGLDIARDNGLLVFQIESNSLLEIQEIEKSLFIILRMG